MPRIIVGDKSLVHQVWELLDQQIKPFDIGVTLGMSQRTVERLGAARVAFRNGRPSGEIASGNQWVLKRVAELQMFWNEYRNSHSPGDQATNTETRRLDSTSEQLEDIRLMLAAQNSGVATAQSRHVERLLKLTKMIRQCLHDPRLDREPYFGVGRPLALGTWDWSLVPDQWVRAVTPDFSDEDRWGDNFPSLKEHLKGSAFWDHLNELNQLADTLQHDMNTAAQAYGREDLTFLACWEKIQRKLQWCTQVSRVPDYPDVDSSNIKLPYRDTYAQKVCKIFSTGPMPEIYTRQWELISKLDDLNKDLRSDTIEKILLSSTSRCANCFTTSDCLLDL